MRECEWKETAGKGRTENDDNQLSGDAVQQWQSRQPTYMDDRPSAAYYWPRTSSDGSDSTSTQRWHYLGDIGYRGGSGNYCRKEVVTDPSLRRGRS